ncbi:hypothetical protein, partial [Streptomyces sp. NPDC001719]
MGKNVTARGRELHDAQAASAEEFRDRRQLPISPIFNTVAWYAVVLQLSDTRILTARPAPRPGAKSVTNAMLEVGNDLSIPELP